MATQQRENVKKLLLLHCHMTHNSEPVQCRLHLREKRAEHHVIWTIKAGRRCGACTQLRRLNLAIATNHRLSASREATHDVKSENPLLETT